MVIYGYSSEALLPIGFDTLLWVSPTLFYSPTLSGSQCEQTFFTADNELTIDRLRAKSATGRASSPLETSWATLRMHCRYRQSLTWLKLWLPFGSAQSLRYIFRDWITAYYGLNNRTAVIWLNLWCIYSGLRSPNIFIGHKSYSNSRNSRDLSKETIFLAFSSAKNFDLFQANKNCR